MVLASNGDFTKIYAVFGNGTESLLFNTCGVNAGDACAATPAVSAPSACAMIFSASLALAGWLIVGNNAGADARLVPNISFGLKSCPPAAFFGDAELSRRRQVEYDLRMFQKLIALAAWTLLAFIAYATISPIQDRPRLPTSSSLEHLAAFAVVGVLFCIAYPRQIVLVCLIVLGSAVLLEFSQLLTPDRHGRVQDAVEKMAGGAVGIIVGRLIVYLARANRWLQS